MTDLAEILPMHNMHLDEQQPFFKHPTTQVVEKLCGRPGSGGAASYTSGDTNSTTQRYEEK